MFAAGLGWRDGSPAAPSYDQGTPDEAIQAITLLLERGFDLNAANDNGDTALHLAVTNRGAPEIVRFLIARGANLKAQNKRGQTPLAAAMASRKELGHLVEILQRGRSAVKPAAVCLVVLAMLAGLRPATSAQDDARPAGGPAQIHPAAASTLGTYCATCHNGRMRSPSGPAARRVRRRADRIAAGASGRGPTASCRRARCRRWERRGPIAPSVDAVLAAIEQALGADAAHRRRRRREPGDRHAPRGAAVERRAR